MSKFPDQNTTNSTEVKAKSVEEAVSEALKELGIEEVDAEIEVVQEPSKGLFGIGAKEAIVKESRKGEVAPEKAEEPDADDAPGAADDTEAAETAKKFISDILTAMGLNAEVEAELDGDVVKVQISGEGMGIVIGKRGDTLDSLQYLTSLVVNRRTKDYIKVSIDTENYREKRNDTLIALSNRLAAKVAHTGKKFALEPMNPYERRIIHANLQNNEDVTTFSIGQEPYRKVVIAPKNAKRGYGKGHGSQDRPNRSGNEKPASPASSVTYKADFKPQQHKAEYKNFEEYLAAHSND